MSNFIILLILIIVNNILGDEPQVRVPQGRLEGYWKESLNGRQFAAFEGIPYAKPPLRIYRFEAPIPAKAWRGVLQAKLFPNICLQWFYIQGDDPNSLIGHEDCLYLNVYSPNLNPKNKLPVLAYMHGGSFLYGSSMEYGPRFLMDHDIIYVSINYRLGPLGFLSTLDEIVPGNNGLKDQQVALEWIKDNIKYFGGDPNQVTIMGMSAGGASVHYHMLSEKSRGLFHKAISQSGTALCPWTLQIEARQKAFRLGEFLGCPTNDTDEMITCLKLRPAEAIVRSVQPAFMVYDHTPHAPFTPVVETVDSSDPFLTKHPYAIIEEGGVADVPWITSIVTKEGIFPGGIYLSHSDFLKTINSKWAEFAPHMYEYNNTIPLELREEVSIKIKEKYLEGDLSEENIGKFLDSLSDRHFKICMEKTVKSQSFKKKEPTYVYEFGYSGKTSLGNKFWDPKENYGVCHGDDTGYSLDTTYMDPTTTEEDRKMIEFMTKLIASFVISGNPDVGSVEWEPVKIENDEINYLKIMSPDDVKMDKTKHFGETEFWDSLGIMENEALFKSEEKDEL